MIAMLDLGEALMTLGFDTSEIDSKSPMQLIVLVMLLLERLLLLGWTNGIPMIFKYDLDWGNWEDNTSS